MPLSRLDYRKTVASVLGSGLAHFLSSCCEWREAQVADNGGSSPVYSHKELRPSVK